MAWQTSTINPATTSPAQDISKIVNDLSVLKGVIGGTPDAAVPSTWTTALAALQQAFNSGTTGGTSTAFTLTPSTAIAAYTAGMTFWVTFHTACGASPTLQISGVASPPNLVRQLGDGTYANVGAADIPANHRSRVTLLSATQALVEDMPAPASASIKQAMLAANVAGNGPAFSAWQSGAQSVTNNTNTVAQFNNKEFDTAGCYNNTGSTATLNGLSVPAYSFMPNVAGYYQVSANVMIGTSIGVAQTYINKNGSNYKIGSSGTSDGGNAFGAASVIVYLNGTTDYLQAAVFHTGGAAKNVTASQTFTYFQASLIRAA